MKKKLFFKFFVFAVIGALVTMTSCKDYDDDITRIDTGLNGVKSDLTSQLAAIKTEMNASVDSKVKTVADGLAAEKTELDKLKAELATLKASGASDEDIAALEKKIADTKTEIMNLVVTLEAFNSFKESNTTELEALMARVVALEAGSATKAELADAKTALEERIKALEDASETYATKAELEDLEEALKLVDDALAGRITSLEENSATKAEMEALEAEIAGKLVALQGQLDALDVRVVALEKSLADLMAKHDEDVEDLIGKIGALRSELDPRITTIETLLEIADGKSGALDKITDELAAQLEKINANAEAIELLRTDLEAELAEQLALIKANEEAINGVAEDLAAKYAELVAADEDLQKQITDNYNELNGKITVNKEAIDALDLRVKGIEDKLPVIEKSIVDLGTELNLRIDSVFKLVSNRLTAITLAPNAYVDGVEAVKFSSLTYSPMEAEEDAEVLDTYTMSIGAPAVASYKFNPRTFVLGNADYNYVDRTAEIIMTTRAAGTSNFVAIEGAPVYKPADGTVNFTLRRLNAHSTQAPADKENFIGLEATLKGAALAEGETGVVIAAPQELVYDDLITPFDLFISDKATLTTAGDNAHYPVTFSDAKAGKIWYEVAYDKVFDLLAKVATCDVTDGHKAFDINAYNLKYKFSVASSEYNITEGSTVTNQQDWVELVSSEDGTYKAKAFNKELIGRTPILKVELVDQANNVVRRAFVKVKFVAEKFEDLTVGTTHDLVFECEDTKASYTLSEQFIRDNVYRVITSGKETSMSHEEFWNLYAPHSTEVRKNNVVATFSQPKIVDGSGGVSTATKKITWDFTHGEIGTVGAGAQLVATVTVKNKLASSEFPEYVTFKFTVNVTLPDVTLPAANKVENDQYWLKNADGSYYAYNVNINVPNSPTSPASQAQFRTSLPQAYTKYIVVGAPNCVTNHYKVVATYSNGVKTTNPLPGVQIDGTDITLDKTNAAVKTALNSAGGLQASVAHIYTLANGDEITVNTFLVNFIRPVNFNMPSGVTVTDAQDGGDVADFQWNGLLTDWRDFPIVADEWNRVQHDHSYWKNIYKPEYAFQPGYNKVVTPAKFNVEMGEIEFTIGSGSSVTMYKGTGVYQVQKRTWQGGYFGSWSDWANEGTATTLVTDAMLTEADVIALLDAKKDELTANLPADNWGTQYQLLTSPYDITSEVVSGGSGQTIKYSYVKSVTYVPAVYEWVEGEFVLVPHTPTARPTFDGTSDGQVVGDWMWTTYSWNHPTWSPGQYWFYYGPFSSINVDTNPANVTTNLDYNENKLPSSVTLTQVGNTVKYVNVGAPVGYSYEIYIPVTVTYGWGSLSTKLTINVSPVQ